VRARVRRSGFKLTGAGVARLLLVAAGSILLAWLVVRTSAVDALIRRNPIAAAAISPDNPRVKIALAMLEFKLNGGRVNEASRRGAFSALSKSPLAEDPFMLAGIDALAKGDEQKGEALLAETRRRDPRARTARLILLDRYLRSGRTQEAAVEIAVINRLVARAAEVLVPELVRMISDPATGDALISLLREDRALRNEVLNRLATAGADPDLIMRVARRTGVERGNAPVPAWQPALLTKMVEKGDVKRASELWRSFAGIGGADSSSAPYDGSFRGLPGPAPFNWQLNSSGAGVAERTPAHSLDVEYYGRERADLASQLVMLVPGRYRLTFRAQGDASGQGSRLAWIVACSGPATAELLEAPLQRVNSSPKMMAAAFTVPASGCPAQWLRLTGIPDEFPTGQSATIADVRIRPEGS
jgi:hypothetical protein